MSDNQQSAVSAVSVAHDSGVMMGFQNLAAFEFMQRAAKLFASSTMVPVAYQAVVSKGYGASQKWEQNPAALSNCMVALDLAQRMNASPLQVMQNLHVIEGRPSWSSPFIIALINNSGDYAHGLRFRFEWLDEVDAVYTCYEWTNNVKHEVTKTVRIKNARCVAWTKDKSGELVESSPVTLEMAVQEGWYTRNGSKWRTMPQQMAQYRAAAFFGRAYNPELLMGLPTADELHDIIDVVPQTDGSYAVPPADVVPQAGAPAPADAERKPRAPRAKAQPQPTETVITQEAAPLDDAAADAAPAPAPAAALEPSPDTAAGSDEASDSQGADAAAEQRIDDLFDGAPDSAPAQQVTPEPTPAPAPAPAPANPGAQLPGKPLSAAKIKFVQDQLNTVPHATKFAERFKCEPSELRDVQFPDVLAWLKDPTK